MKIAFIGTGVMGAAMAHNLAKAGNELHVYNRTKSKAQACAEFGAIVHDEISECVKNCDVVFTIVGYPSDVKEVYEEIFKYAKRNIVAADMTTSSPSLAIELAKRGKENQIEILDAPVSGGDSGAKNGTLSIMVGGEYNSYKQILPLFECMGKNIVYMGEAGAGQHTKMANQVAIAGTVSGVAEALAYAKKAGLDSETLLKAISAGAAGSWQMSNNGPKIIAEDYDPGFYIKHFIKDMRLALEEENQAGLNLIVLKEVLQAYEQLEAQGLEDEGTQAIAKYY